MAAFKIFIADLVLLDHGLLDPALIRPGRVDVKEYIGWCSQFQIEQMFLRFYKGETAVGEAKQFSENVVSTGKPVSPAQIQGYFMFHKQSPGSKVVDNYKQIWELS